MTDDVLQELRAALHAMREEVLALDRAGAEDTRPVELDQAKVGRLSRMDAIQAQQMAEASARRRRERLPRIEGALRRIESGDYGECFVCGEEIALARLRSDPTVTRCIDCAEAQGG